MTRTRSLRGRSSISSWQERLSGETIAVLDAARNHSSRLRSPGRIGTDHLVLALTTDERVADEIRRAGASPDDVRDRAEQAAVWVNRPFEELDVLELDDSPIQISGTGNLHLHPYTPLARHALANAGLMAMRSGADRITPAHLFVSLIELHQGIGPSILRDLGVTGVSSE